MSLHAKSGSRLMGADQRASKYCFSKRSNADGGTTARNSAQPRTQSGSGQGGDTQQGTCRRARRRMPD
eukprot:12481999-Alexandrium_andersonii.AAC.1